MRRTAHPLSAHFTCLLAIARTIARLAAALLSDRLAIAPPFTETASRFSSQLRRSISAQATGEPKRRWQRHEALDCEHPGEWHSRSGMSRQKRINSRKHESTIYNPAAGRVVDATLVSRGDRHARARTRERTRTRARVQDPCQSKKRAKCMRNTDHDYVISTLTIRTRNVVGKTCTYKFEMQLLAYVVLILSIFIHTRVAHTRPRGGRGAGAGEGTAPREYLAEIPGVNILFLTCSSL